MNNNDWERFWFRHGLPISQRHHEDVVIQRCAIVVLLLAGVVGLYALLAVYGVVPAAPWSPVGKAS